MRLHLRKPNFFCKYFLLAASFWLISFNARSQTILAPGEIAFVGYISADDAVDGAIQDDEFAFILLKDITTGTIIQFTDFGWLTAGGFQTANPCGPNTGAINDGIITWTATGNMLCGTQIRIKCKYTLQATAGTVTGTQACNNDPTAYLSLAIGGDQIFAYQGTHASPTLLAGISINKPWDAALVSCFFSSNSSVLPAALGATANTTAVSVAINAKYDCSLLNDLPPNLIVAINNPANWLKDNTFVPPIPVGFQLPLSCSFSCAPANISVGPVSGTIIACQGTPSASPDIQQFTASGSSLTADILVTAPVNFEVSTSSGSGYGPSVTLIQSGGTVPPTIIYVRSAASAPIGPISGNVVLTSTGATTMNVAVNGTVNPTPNAVATPPSQTTCSGIPITTIVLSGAVGGTTFNWTRNNTVTVTGIAASGSGDISGVLTNTTLAPVTVTFTITPTANGCPGAPITATVTVNPTPIVNPVPNQTVCNNAPTTPVIFSGPVPGTNFNWVNNTPSIGLAASGSGNIASFNAINITNVPVTATITVTPSTGGASAPATVAVSGFLNNNANATILFNFRNNNAYPVTVTGIESICSTNGLKDVSAYYKISAINGLPGAITVANGWNQFGAAVITGIANTTTTTTQPFMTGLTLVVPAGATYGICVQAVNQGTTTAAQRYSSIAAGTYTFSTAGCDIVTGTNMGYGGIAVPGAPTFTPRGFMGKITFTAPGGGPVCTGPTTSFNITVNPTPNAVATPPTQTICSGTAMTPIVVSGNVAGTVFNWTRNNQVNVTGIANAGTGNISGTPINNTTVQQTVTFTITPTANGCAGAPITATLIVNVAPTITCPANITVNNTPGQCGANVTYPPATATGSPPPVITYSQASGSFFPVGTTTVTATATNICGTASCTFTITVIDAQAPTITCPANIVQNTDVGACVATVATPNPTTTDNCGVTAVTWVMTGATTGSSPATGINYVGTRAFNLNGTTGQGVTTITYTVRDAAGNTSSCSFTVTVIDAWIPVISGQPANQTVCVGSDAVFTVTASVPAGNPLTYQWQTWNGSAWVNIAGATNATLTVNAVTLSMNTNSFRVLLTGRCSVVTSAFATLYVNALPTVSILASGPLALLPAQSVTLTAVVNPGGGSYQWFKNGVAIPGATSASLTGLTVDDIGAYRVRYTDLNGCVSTSAEMLVSGRVSDGLFIYPNPNDGHFHVRFYNQANEEVTVRVFDMRGALVYLKEVITVLPYTDIDIDMRNRITATAAYVVEVRGGDGRLIGSKKIIIHK